MGLCREVIRMGGRHDIHDHRGLGGGREEGCGGIRRRGALESRWEVIPGTELSRLPLTRRFPWRVAKSHLRKGDMMALGRPMEAAGRCSVGRLRRILGTRRDKNSDQCGSDEEQEPVHSKNPLWSAVLLQRVPNGVFKKSRQSYFHQIDR